MSRLSVSNYVFLVLIIILPFVLSSAKGGGVFYTLTITVTSGGTTNPAPGSHIYGSMQNVQVTAIPDSCYVFDHWELDTVNAGSANPYSVLMDSNHILHAVFSIINYTLTITTTAGGTTSPASGTYTYACGSNVDVTATPDSCYVFDHWELDGSPVGSVNPYSVLMDDNHSLHAVFVYSPPSLSVSTSPASASIVQGESVHFSSTVSGGASPYTYQWYLDGNPVSGATLSSWTFTPTSTGICYVYLRVTDACNSTAQSDTARITVTSVPVGGYSVTNQTICKDAVNLLHHACSNVRRSNKPHQTQNKKFRNLGLTNDWGNFYI